MKKYYIDYPQEKTEPGLNLYRCAYCKKNHYISMVY